MIHRMWWLKFCFLGISVSKVWRVWSQRGVPPHHLAMRFFTHLDNISLVWSVRMALSALTMTARADVTPAFSSLFTLIFIKSFLSWEKRVHTVGACMHMCSISCSADVKRVFFFSFLFLPSGVAQARVALRTLPAEPTLGWFPSSHSSWCS